MKNIFHAQKESDPSLTCCGLYSGYFFSLPMQDAVFIMIATDIELTANFCKRCEKSKEYSVALLKNINNTNDQ